MIERMGMHVILVGNPRDGYTALGPFKTRDAAEDFIETEPDDCDYMTIIPLDAPQAKTFG